jgi:hypothetical protein
MKNKLSIFFILTSILAILILLLPLLFLCDIKESLTLGATLLTSIAAFATFVVAYLFYDKFGIGKKITEKQTETVIELLEQLRKVWFLIKLEGKDGVTEHLIIRGMSKNLTYFKFDSFNNKYITFHFENYNNGMKSLLSFINNIWIPLEIKEKMNFLDLHVLETTSNNNAYKENFVTISINNSVEKEKEKEFGRKNNEDIKYFQFISSMEILVISIEGWLNKHSNIPIDLNI